MQRIEPARLEEVPEAILDAVAELSAASAKLGHSLHPRTATSLSGTVRIMNTYYSNLIEGHNTRPKDIERALAGQFDKDPERRADMPRQGDLDGRGNVSQRALIDFILWFLRVCIDQVTFMSTLFEVDMLARRLRTYVERSESLKPEAARLLEDALIRGEFERGEISRITGLPERTARRVLNDLIALGLLASDTPKGLVSLRFPVEALEILFPRLCPRGLTGPDDPFSFRSLILWIRLGSIRVRSTGPRVRSKVPP